MNPELVEDLLRAVMKDGADADFPNQLGTLRSLAMYKYDEYQQYAPGRQFIAYLASWLEQFGDPDERRHALQFVRERLVYISDTEMRHLVNLMARDRVPSLLQRQVSQRLGIPDHRMAKVRGLEEFNRAIRASIFLGMSDGARIDQFRRSNPSLSNEQFAMTYELNSGRADAMMNKLRADLDDEEASFQYIFLVDDFAGSGRTILRRDERDSLDGRLYRFIQGTLPLLMKGSCPRIVLALYVAAEQAVDHLRSLLLDFPSPPWAQEDVPQVMAVMTIGDHARLVHGRGGAQFEADLLFDGLLHKYYDKSVEDEHKGEVLHGYAKCGLSIVLSHNTPNNSVYLLWEKDRTKPLFPRYERHQSRLEMG